ncbi:MCE family protein [Blastococcus sp. BMG 814]|uniref:MCE family protein n=1 Tax=Blastococcus carthaginiensis TaxID=3050034 RepID=A0ABT9I7B6_9ACTN|nr:MULTISPECIES: MCE family protein [Blastococcus]MDP5181455.1 MCE family protein [Blastococcus carthaginiensis]SEK32335.1 phospholipid/cholesterol/gamma-HCH transport system substrate-binding protein [Blastococcus sp. DSM 46786]
MSGQLRGLTGPLVKLVAFGVVTVLAAYVLVSTITNAGYGDQVTYRAQFTDVAGLVEGDEVRIAGVRVGQVVAIGLGEGTERPSAEVELEVSADVPLPEAVEATIRYRNLVGQRYIALTEGEGSQGRTLDEGAVIPLSRTTDALDLTVLFGGFQPLLQALSPADVNRVSFEIIQVFQGEGGTVESLLAHVGSLTNSLADRDQVIGSVIDNLTTVMGTLADRDQQLSGLVVSLQQFVTGLAGDREVIFDSLDTIDQLALATSGFLEDARAPLAADIKALDALAGNLADTGDVVERFLQTAPVKLDLTTRTAINGSWFNFFMCRAGGTVTLPATELDPGGRPVARPFEFESGAEGCS